MEISNNSDTELDSLVLKIKNCFTSSSNESELNLKWRLLKEYQSNYIPHINRSRNSLYYYNSITSSLLEALKPTLFSEKTQEKIFEDIFLKGSPQEAFVMLVRKLSQTCESYQQQKILDLLKKLIQMSAIETILLKQCEGTSSSDPKYLASLQTWDELIMFIVSLPDRVANKTKGQVNKIFQSHFYIPLVTSSIWKMCVAQHDKIKNNKDCSLQFLGKLIGKLCANGYSDVAAKKLCVELTKSCEKDFLWRRLSENLIGKIPVSALESFITNLLFVMPWYGYLDWILGDSVLKNKNLTYVMTVKLVLVRHFEKIIILQNIIGYFASSSERQSQFIKLFSSLVKMWADESTLKHQSFEQQKYIASALMICSAWLKDIKDISEIQGYMGTILHGTQIRIGNSEENIRILGQVVGMTLISTLKSDAPKFEFEKTSHQLWEDMEKLKVIPSSPESCFKFDMKELNCFDELESESNKRASNSNNKEVIEKEEADSDSDGDLEPYALPDESSSKNVKKPLYLIDCFQGLLEQEDEDWFEQCLLSAESLIESHSYMVHEVAVEMAKILLHLEDKYNISNFSSLRFNTLIALVVNCPVLVSSYLTSQFYERDYNIRQRLDVLEVLVESSKYLSRPKEAPKPSLVPCTREGFNMSVDNDWKVIIDERIVSKTRFITKGPRKPTADMLENQFAPVAGHFFFPLMEKYDRENKMLNLQGEDSYVLGRLIYTLGIIMHSSSNIPLASHMGKTLLLFLSDVRNNSDTFVRQSSIFAMATVYTSVPGYLLYADMSPDVLESQQWLHSVIENDPDTNCRVKASCALSLVLNIMKEEMPFLSEIMAT